MRGKPIILMLVAVLLLLVACSPRATVVVEETQPPAETPLAKPQAGKATMIGQVVSIVDGTPLAETVVRLAEVYREGGKGAFVLNGAYSPGAITDQHGRFVIENIEAREYVIVVGDVYDRYQIMAEPSGEGRVFKAVEDQIMDVGELQVDLSLD